MEEQLQTQLEWFVPQKKLAGEVGDMPSQYVYRVELAGERLIGLFEPSTSELYTVLARQID